MSAPKDPIFRAYLINIGKREGLNPEQVNYVVDNCFEESKYYPIDTTKEKVTITRNEDGDILIATSKKFPNVRFHLGKLLFLIVKTAAKVTALKAVPIAVLYFIFDFLKDVLELIKFELTKSEAEVLIGIYELSKKLPPNQPISTDHVLDYLKGSMSPSKINKSIENLGKLQCIELDMKKIVLNETIAIQSDDI